MPEISRFFGIVVQMYYADHDPPHFHVRYAEQRALIAIESLAILQRLPFAARIGTRHRMGHAAPH